MRRSGNEKAIIRTPNHPVPLPHPLRQMNALCFQFYGEANVSGNQQRQPPRSTQSRNLAAKTLSFRMLIMPKDNTGMGGQRFDERQGIWETCFVGYEQKARRINWLVRISFVRVRFAWRVGSVRRHSF